MNRVKCSRLARIKMSRVSTLWHLHLADQEMDAKAKRARQIDDLLANVPQVAAARAALEAEQQQLEELRATLRARELEAQSLEAKIKASEARLYSGSITNPKELEDMEKDQQMHYRQRSELDGQRLELMEAVGHAQRSVDEKSESLKTVEATRAGEVERLERERKTLASRLAQLSTERSEARAALDAAALAVYDQLRATKGGRAMAQLQHDACGACGVQAPIGLLNRVRVGEELVFCAGCGRILAS